MEESMLIGIGGVGLSLATREPGVAECLNRRYGAFPLCGPPLATVRVLADPSLRPVSPDCLEISGRGSRLWVESSTLKGRLDLKRKQGYLALAEEGIENGLTDFLRNSFQWLLLARGGCLLHGAGLLNNGAVYLFFGPSGSGKTTLARETAGARVLNDEYVAVTTAHGSVRAWGTPFWGDMEEGENTGKGGKLLALLRLRHGDGWRLEDLPPSRALADLVHCIPVVTGQKREADRILDLALSVLKRVPCYSMQFKSGVSHWREIPESFDDISQKKR